MGISLSSDTSSGYLCSLQLNANPSISPVYDGPRSYVAEGTGWALAGLSLGSRWLLGLEGETLFTQLGTLTSLRRADGFSGWSFQDPQLPREETCSAHGLAHYHHGHLIPITWPGLGYTECPFWKLPGLGAAK